jgi:hypothetical protein
VRASLMWPMKNMEAVGFLVIVAAMVALAVIIA